jgi:uncharacterized protein (TIGR02391 family)
MSRSKSVPPTRPASANLSPAQIRAAIPQLQRRVAELEALPVASITSSNDPRVLALEQAIDGTLATIFGPDTHEYDRLRRAKNLDLTAYVMIVQLGSRFAADRRGRAGSPTAGEIQQGIERGRQQASALLIQQISLMKEQLGVEGDSPADRSIRACCYLDLHPEIARAANDLYQNGHYANAIEDAVKALNGLVRLRSGETLDGALLMQRVFSPKNPFLCFNELKDQTDQDEQQGFTMLFWGAVAGLRNPRAHRLITDDPERALEIIAFVSLLAKLLDGAKKTPSP